MHRKMAFGMHALAKQVQQVCIRLFFFCICDGESVNPRTRPKGVVIIRQFHEYKSNRSRITQVNIIYNHKGSFGKEVDICCQKPIPAAT